MQKITVSVEMADGTVHENLRVVLKDQIRFGDVRAKHNWPSMEEDPMRFGAFLAYAAMTRLGLYPPERGFDEWVDDVAWVDADMGAELDPTQPTTPASS